MQHDDDHNDNDRQSPPRSPSPALRPEYPHSPTFANPPLPHEAPPSLDGDVEDIGDDVDKLRRELQTVRPILAGRILTLLAIVIILYVLLVATKRYTGVEVTDVGPWFNTVFTGLMTLAGSAVGFYFGHRADPPRRNRGDGNETE